MSGPFGSSQWMYSSGAAFYPFAIDQSLRFNDNDSAYLSRTPASAGNQDKWTWSGWFKRGDVNTESYLFSAGTSSTELFYIQMRSNSFGNVINITWRDNSSTTRTLITNAVYRDPSSWYHIVLTLDVAQASDADKMKLYVNGELVTSFSSDSRSTLSSSSSLPVNSTDLHTIGRYALIASDYLDGYLAEVNFIDGQALDPTSFGEFKSGVWIPKQYGGTYGTNGFRLSFADSSNIGDDTSGNTNDWTANSLVATDVLLDSPTNNFAVWNVLARDTQIDLLEGNLETSSGGTDMGGIISTFAQSSGKWYWEVLGISGTAALSVGIADLPLSAYNENQAGTYLYLSGGSKRISPSTTSSYGASFTDGDIIGVALDMDAGSVTFYKNGVSQGTAFTGLSGTFAAFIQDGSNTTALNSCANFGQDSSFAGNKTAQGNTDDNGIGDFYYAPPSGYLALCTANLPDPVIDPAQDDVPSDYFNTVLYTGTGTTDQSVTGVGFQPDFTWIKARSNTYYHWLNDAVRGAGKGLVTNTTDAEYTSLPIFLSFDNDGFTVDVDSATANNTTNGSGQSFVAWNWLAGNGTSSNTDGTISSTVSVNQKAGFSVVSYTGTGSAATVGHGLGVAPKFITHKNRDASANWLTRSLGTGSWLSGWLNLTNALGSTGLTTSSTTFDVGAASDNNGSGNAMIAYCFAEVEGYSKFGSFVGNGSNDGPFIYTGFRPAFVMVKRTDSIGNWQILDTKRSSFNVSNANLYANLSNAEVNGGNEDMDILSNGWKPRNASASFNINGGTYIFMAFAEMPFRYSNAR